MSKYDDRQNNAFDKVLARIGFAVLGFGEWCERDGWAQMKVREVRIRAPREAGEDYMVIVKAQVEGRMLVGFHGATSIEEAIRGAYERINNNSMKWKDDEGFVPRAKGGG